MSVTDTRTDSSDAVVDRNAECAQVSSVTQPAIGQSVPIQGTVTCCRCGTAIPYDVMMVVCSIGPHIVRGCKPGQPWCCACAGDKEHRLYLLPWLRNGARTAGRHRPEYTHRCACGRCFYGALTRRHCSDECAVRTRNARRPALRDRRRQERIDFPDLCHLCRNPMPGSRRGRDYCSNACRQKAYRKRAAAELAKRTEANRLLREYDRRLAGGAS